MSKENKVLYPRQTDKDNCQVIINKKFNYLHQNVTINSIVNIIVTCVTTWAARRSPNVKVSCTELVVENT